MLRLGWLLILVPSALAAPSVTVTQYSENEIGPVKDDGRYSYYIRRAWDLLDGGDVNVNTLTSQVVTNDMADSSEGPALAFGLTLGILGELTPGYAGDACAAASVNQAYVSGKPIAIRQALLNYARQLAYYIDLILQLAVDPSSVKYATGFRGGCKGGGRIYDFEGVWNINLATASPRASRISQRLTGSTSHIDTGCSTLTKKINDVTNPDFSLYYEQYCTAKRLNSALNVRSNNIAATLTASTTPGVQNLLRLVAGELFNFFRSLVTGVNRQKAATLAKNAIISAVGRVNV